MPLDPERNWNTKTVLMGLRRVALGDHKVHFVGNSVEREQDLAVTRLLSEDRIPLPLSGSGETLHRTVIEIGSATATAASLRERIAPADCALAAIYAIATRHGLDPLFPGQLREELKAPIALPTVDASDLANLTGLPFCAIDGTDPHDLVRAQCVCMRQDLKRRTQR